MTSPSQLSGQSFFRRRPRPSALAASDHDQRVRFQNRQQGLPRVAAQVDGNAGFHLAALCDHSQPPFRKVHQNRRTGQRKRIRDNLRDYYSDASAQGLGQCAGLSQSRERSFHRREHHRNLEFGVCRFGERTCRDSSNRRDHSFQCECHWIPPFTYERKSPRLKKSLERDKEIVKSMEIVPLPCARFTAKPPHQPDTCRVLLPLQSSERAGVEVGVI